MKGERLLKQIQITLGFKYSPEQEIAINQARQDLITRQEQIIQVADALAHSDACPSEAEFVLGFSSEDPHPNHAIQFNPKHPFPELLSKEYPRILKNQEPPKPKI